MLNVLQTIKDEVLDDRLIQSCKEMIEKTGLDSTIILVCNSKSARRHMMTIATNMMFTGGWCKMVQNVAQLARADAILTIITRDQVAGKTALSFTIETLFDRYAVAYHYDKIGQVVVWHEPTQMEGDIGRYGKLLPVPDGMARA